MRKGRTRCAWVDGRVTSSSYLRISAGIVRSILHCFAVSLPLGWRLANSTAWKPFSPQLAQRSLSVDGSAPRRAARLRSDYPVVLTVCRMAHSPSLLAKVPVFRAVFFFRIRIFISSFSSRRVVSCCSCSSVSVSCGGLTFSYFIFDSPLSSHCIICRSNAVHEKEDASRRKTKND